MAFSWTVVLTTVAFCVFNSFSLVDSRQLPDLYWNSSNPIFQADPDGEAHMMSAEIMDSLTIRCPYYNDSSLLEHTEQAIIYRVTKAGFDKCRVDETSKPVAMCNDPFSVVTNRIVFRLFTPLPSGLEYQPGNTYYFISTSDGSKDGLNFRLGGLCMEHNLRLKIVMRQQDDGKLDGGVVDEMDAELLPEADDEISDEDEDDDDEEPLTVKFRLPKPDLRYIPPAVTSTNGVDSYMAAYSGGPAATTPVFWGDFLANAYNGRVGQVRFTSTTSPKLPSSFLNHDGLQDDRDETPMTYRVESGPTDANKRRGLREKNEEETRLRNSLLAADSNFNEQLPIMSVDDPGYEIHELPGDLTLSSLYSSSLSSRRPSFINLLMLFVCSIVAVRWLL